MVTSHTASPAHMVVQLRISHMSMVVVEVVVMVVLVEVLMWCRVYLNTHSCIARTAQLCNIKVMCQEPGVGNGGEYRNIKTEIFHIRGPTIITFIHVFIQALGFEQENLATVTALLSKTNNPP